ncbi:MAG TPA: GTP cyclohydrolase I, partial [Nitriliruptorales bacterium]
MTSDEQIDPATSSRERVRHITGIDPRTTFDHDKIRQAVRLFLEAIGEDPDRDGLRDTPDRVARAADELFAGMLVEPTEVLSAVFDEGHDEMVMQRDIPLYSMCEHHLLPWFGKAH